MMPTLSLMPIQSGQPPEAVNAGANSGTEGREGSAAVSTNDGSAEKTWTRTFHSYIAQIGQTATPGQKTKSPKTVAVETAGLIASAQLPPAVAAALPVTTPPSAAAAHGTVSTAPAIVVSGPAASQPVAAEIANSPALPQLGAAPSDGFAKAAAAPVAAPVLTPLPMSDVKGAPAAPVASAGTSFLAPAALTQSTVAVASSLVVPSLAPASSTNDLAIAQSPPVPLSVRNAAVSTVAAGNSAVQATVPALPQVTAGALDGAAPPSAVAKPSLALPSFQSSSRTTQRVGFGSRAAPQIKPVAGITAASAAPIAASPSASQASAPSPADAVSVQPPAASTDTPSLPASMPAAVASALTSGIISLSGPNGSAVQAPAVATDDKPLSPGMAKAGMVRDQVLGGGQAALKAPSASGHEADNASSSDSSAGSGNLAQDAAGQTPVPANFSTALAAVAPAYSPASATANAAAVQGSSLTERIHVVGQISAHIQSLQPSTANPNTMTVSIQPPHWGDVKIAVTLNPAEAGGPVGGSVSATVTASTSEVQGVLQQHMQDLKGSLSSAGMHLDKLEVGVGAVTAAAQSGAASGHHSGQSGSNPGQSNYQSSTPDGSFGSTSSGGSFQSTFGSDYGDGSESTGEVQSPTSRTAVSAGAGEITQTAASSHIDMRA